MAGFRQKGGCPDTDQLRFSSVGAATRPAWIIDGFQARPGRARQQLAASAGGIASEIIFVSSRNC
jgi:hypothetical protein